MSGRINKENKKVKWSQHSLIKAFQLVEEGKPIREAARATGVPFSTLQERLKTKNKNIPRLGRNTVFTEEQEEELTSKVQSLAKIFYGCSSLKIKKMAYEYANKNKIKHNFNKSLGLAGKDWIKGFMRRNNLIAEAKAEGTRLIRATSFKKDEVAIFFELLEELMKKYKFLPRSIYNVYDTAVSSVQDPVGSISSGARCKTVTAVCAMSAMGVYLPPMLIYTRQRHSATLERDGPRGAVYRCSSNGSINEEIFVDWLHHFADYTKPSEKEPIMLVLDNHSSHISLTAYEFCEINHIVLLSLPPNGSHRIQPMHFSIDGPFKAAYKHECNIFLTSQLRAKITPNDIASLFKKAFQKVATIPKAEAGFAATGIYPLNPGVFNEEDFFPDDILKNSELVMVDEEMQETINITLDSDSKFTELMDPISISPSDTTLMKNANMN